MKRIWLTSAIFSIMAITAVFFPGCLKDKCSHTYKIYTPVYRTTSEVRANIKSNDPQNIVNPGKIFIRGKYIFLNEVDKGVHIIDNSNPASPVKVAFIDIPGNMDLAVRGNTMYADLYTDLVAIDISEPLKAVTKKIIDDAFPGRRYSNGFVAQNDKIIVDWIERDTTISTDCNGGNFWWGCPTCNIAFDMSTAATAAQAASPVGMGGSMARFAIVNSTLYTVGNADLSAYSIANAEDPVFTNKLNITWGIETIYPFKDKLFIGSNTGMFIYSITNPDNPVKLGQFSHVTACDPVIADDKYAFVTLRNGARCANASNQLDILDISTITSPALLKTYPLTNPHGLSKDENTLFVCDGSDGLKIFDASNLPELKLQDHIKGFESYDVIAFNKLALVVAKDGLRQYDYTDLTNIRMVSKIGWTH